MDSFLYLTTSTTILKITIEMKFEQKDTLFVNMDMPYRKCFPIVGLSSGNIIQLWLRVLLVRESHIL